MPSSRNVFLLLILALVTTTGHGLKVAIFALDLSGSQLLWNVRVAHTLLKAGHNVTLIRLQTWTYKEATAKIDPRVDQWVVNAVVPGFDFEKLQEQQAEMAFKSESALKMLSAEGRKKWSQFSDIFALGCKEVLKKKDFMEKLKASDFDIAFSHMYDYCAIGLIHYAQTPTWIWLNSASLIDYVARDIGSPMPPSYVPPMLMDASDKMTFFQRVKSFFGYFIVTYFHHHVVAPKETEVFRRVVDPSFPDLRELSRKVPLVMVNSDEFYDLTRPTLHKIINVGGLGMKKTEANPLPDEYAKLVDAASSVVVFTFGSVVNASLMPQEMKEEFMKAFARFPDTQFFFRYPLTDIDHIKPKNVMMAKWLPQNDLLQHPKTRALISHGGYNSLQEAINSGTPIITIPLFGDQFRNGRIAESQGFGYYLDKTNLNENTIAEAIETVLVNERYSTTVKKIQRMVEAKPRKAEESLVKWTEFLAEFKELPNLTPHGVHLRQADMGNKTDSAAVDDPSSANLEDTSPSKMAKRANEEPHVPKHLLPREPGSSNPTTEDPSDPVTSTQNRQSASQEAQLPQSSHDSAMDEAPAASVIAVEKSKDKDKPSSKKYHFDDEGSLVDEEGSPYKYTKAEYENVAASVTDMVYERLTSPPLSLKKISLTDKQPHWREEDSFVFISDNLDEADKLVVIIHGSGQVRAGQWSRRLIINESLEVGSQIPYIRRCQEHGWAVLVTNTNDNYYVDEKGKKQKKAFSGTPIEHGLEAWRAFVFHNKNLKKIAIVAHSFGGHVTGEILSRTRDDDDRVVAVCLTDAFVDSEIVRKFDHHILACNWVGSSEPLDTESNDSDRYMKVVSAGTKEHERTSHCCIDSVFRMIEEAFGSTVV